MTGGRPSGRPFLFISPLVFDRQFLPHSLRKICRPGSNRRAKSADQLSRSSGFTAKTVDFRRLRAPLLRRAMA